MKGRTEEDTRDIGFRENRKKIIKKMEEEFESYTRMMNGKGGKGAYKRKWRRWEEHEKRGVTEPSVEK